MMKPVNKRFAVAFAATCLASSLSFAHEASTRASAGTEPNVKVASEWWPPQRNVWTPLGWKSHLLRFHSTWNGSLLVSPGGWLTKPHTAKYKADDWQLNFHPSLEGNLPPLPKESVKLYQLDVNNVGIGNQRWRDDHETPILVTEWPMQDGVVMRQEVFTHLKGGKKIETGVEPLYAWVRLSVAYVHPVRPPAKYVFGVQLSKLYYEVGGSLQESVFIAATPQKAKFAEPLAARPVDAADASAGLLIQQGEKSLLRVMPNAAGPVSLAEIGEGAGVYNLKVELPAKVGASTDLLVPIVAVSPQDLAAEAALGFDGALKESEAFWNDKPKTAARIHTPEPYINEALRRNVQFAQIIAERNPDNGEYSFLSGSFGYDTLWSTPTSMISHMFLDLLGYHDVVAQHVELYKKNQGSVQPPGPGWKPHAGYFSTPKTLTSIDWLSDHGAILEILGRHALLTGDRAFVDHWLEPILKGMDFVKDSCALTGHDGVKGLMPPGIATDSGVPSQAVWNQAWIFKGFTTATKLLRQIDHPRAAEFEQFADEYRGTFQKAFAEQTAKEPKWTAPDGKAYPILPANLIPSPVHHVYDDAFLLDTGPLVLPFAGLMDASHPDMKSFADFFRYGPNRKLVGSQTGAIVRAFLDYEIASCEPCYSWNIVNSWQTGDRGRFLEGMYSLFTGAISTQTYINSEHRHSMYGNVFVAPLMTWSLRQAVIDDQLKQGELHLLRLVPLAWVTSADTTRFENMPTEYGPVDLTFRKSADGTSLDVTFTARWRKQPGKIVLHAPPASGLKTIQVNGKPFAVTGSEIVLPADVTTVDATAANRGTATAPPTAQP